MPGHDVIVIGASAGGVEALTHLVRKLPADLPAAIFIVVHVPAYGTSALPNILSRKGPLPAVHPVDGQAIENGNIYVAPPDHHLLLKDGHIRVTRGPSENGHRPAVDPLFRSAALACDSRVIGVILSGTLDDGTSGLLSIKERGGLAVVQDPDEALFSGMPRSAVENAKPDYTLPLDAIADVLVRLAHEPARENVGPAPPELDIQVRIPEMNMDAIETARDGDPSGFTCPECHGVLWETEEGPLIRYRCRTGHAYSPGSLMAEQSQGLEDALWTAFRALEESAALSQRLRERALGRGHRLAADRFGEQAQDCLARARIVRQALLRGQTAAPDTPAAQAERTSGLNSNPGGDLPNT